MKLYKVVKCDIEGNQTAPSISIKATSPEEAAELVLGEVLTKRGKPGNLFAKAYHEGSDGSMSMQRLYLMPIE